jgi:hypothetical protein
MRVASSRLLASLWAPKGLHETGCSAERCRLPAAALGVEPPRELPQSPQIATARKAALTGADALSSSRAAASRRARRRHARNRHHQWTLLGPQPLRRTGRCPLASAGLAELAPHWPRLLGRQTFFLPRWDVGLALVADTAAFAPLSAFAGLWCGLATRLVAERLGANQELMDARACELRRRRFATH